MAIHTTILSVCGFLIMFTPAAKALVLAADQHSDYIIVLAQHATAPEQTAASELQKHLKDVTGVEFPICSEGNIPPSKSCIFVGQSDKVYNLLPSISWNDLGTDGVVLQTKGTNVILAGGRPRGVLYAVYTFLEDIVGCRWWTSTESFVPKTPTLIIPSLNSVYVPKLKYREADYADLRNSDLFAVRLKCNGHFQQRITPQQGGHYNILGWSHTFYQLLPPQTYFDAHPNWYAEINGKRTATMNQPYDGAQLCLTNTQMQKEFARNAIAWIRNEPQAGIIAVVQNDSDGWCQCQTCRALEKEEGSQSGPLLYFVNAVAEEIEKDYPGFYINTAAYSATLNPPRHIKPRRNVLMTISSSGCSYSQPLGQGSQNEAFRRCFETWAKISSQLFVWDYVVNFRNYFMPYPNIHVLAPNIRYFVNHGATGIFEQGNALGGCGDFVGLRAWLLAHLMWDPSRQENSLIQEFMRGYYGDAAPYLLTYLELLRDGVLRAGVRLEMYTPDSSAYLTLADMNRATELFAESLNAVKEDKILWQRVRREQLSLDDTWLSRYAALKLLSKHKGNQFRGPEDPVIACDEFVNTARHYHPQYAEGLTFEEYVPVLRSRFTVHSSPPDICKALPADEWYDIQENMFRLYHGAADDVTVNISDDAASNGKAARMVGDHGTWSVQYPISADLTGTWQCYVVARCNLKDKVVGGKAFSMGIYDEEHRCPVVDKVVSIIDVTDDKYHEYYLGTFDIGRGQYFWISSPYNRENIESVYVDRIIMIKKMM